MNENFALLGGLSCHGLYSILFIQTFRNYVHFPRLNITFQSPNCRIPFSLNGILPCSWSTTICKVLEIRHCICLPCFGLWARGRRSMRGSYKGATFPAHTHISNILYNTHTYVREFQTYTCYINLTCSIWCLGTTYG